MGRDFVIPGVDPAEPDPYRFHTGRKRDHGGEDAIEIIDLVKQFGRARILNGLNLGLPEDQVSMVLGPSGTGKSVLIKHIVGLLYPDSGDVLVHGESIPNMTDDELFEVRKKFGLLFQDGALFGSMNIYDNTAFPLRQHTDKSEEEIGEIVNRRLKEVGLTEATYKMPNELSGGMRKRAGFARALVLEPAIVMFDEPDSGLDPVRTALLCELIREVHAENGGCYLVISHDLNTARRIADFIAVLWNGKIVESGPKEELFDSENAFVEPVPQRGRHRPALDGLSSSTRTAAALGRVAAWAVRHARAVLAVSARARGRRRGRGDAAADRRRHRHAGRLATPRPTGRPQQVREVFGEEPVVVLAEGDLQQLILTAEPRPAAAAGGLPLGQGAARARSRSRGPAPSWRELDPVAVPRRPGDLPQRGGDPDRRTAASGWPPTVPPDQLREFLLAGRRPATGSPAPPASATQNSSPPSSSTCAAPRGTPKARLAYLFPNSHSAQIVMRLRPDLSDAERQPGARA